MLDPITIPYVTGEVYEERDLSEFIGPDTIIVLDTDPEDSSAIVLHEGDPLEMGVGFFVRHDQFEQLLHYGCPIVLLQDIVDNLDLWEEKGWRAFAPWVTQ